MYKILRIVFSPADIKFSTQNWRPIKYKTEEELAKYRKLWPIESILNSKLPALRKLASQLHLYASLPVSIELCFYFLFV